MVNPNKLNKKDLVTYFTKRCKHNHIFATHPNCFLQEQKFRQKVGFLDIECSGLKANFALMLSYAIKEGASDKIYGRVITKKELHGKTLDKELIRDCIKDILKFDVIVTYYGSGFDIPFIRTRALKWDIKEFPLYGVVKHIDAYYMARNRLCLSRKSLEVVARILGIEGKNHVDGDSWMLGGIQGDKKSLEYIFDHNLRDVRVLEKVYDKMKVYCMENNRSL